MRYHEIKQLLKEKIDLLAPDSKLTSRPQLCKELETTRTTLDKAIAELVYEGVLYSAKGSGTYVSNRNAELQITVRETVENWGVIVPNVMDRIYHSLVRGIENIAQNYSANVILCNSDSDAEKQKQYIKRLIAAGVAGFIIVPVITKDFQDNFLLYSQLTQANIPFVFCNRSVEGISAPVITSNDFYGGYIATRHLLDKGYKKIAYISRLKYKTSIDRCQGYLTALMEYGIQVDMELIFIEQIHKDTPAGYETMQELIATRPDVDAVFCFNDRVARGVCTAIEESGLHVSEDIGVLGYDDSEICQSLTPKLTSVSYKSIEIGETAGKILKKMINNIKLSSFEFYLFQPEIVERGSCLGPAVRTHEAIS